ncbi:methyltransferase domain-containing protein [Sphingomonas cannabina]|uniref:class I SAM-dependent methyltransferase n=1 Tax=Sphingomonas cannabina TaxID=2899123 RepID=UPI001F24377D|nr:class I SAM-dependent methyltransferase [Sphingomonas cannabina]UIJ43899.1 methyltransferase domain-containing protein [Sphingomonas cannabina]
MTGAIEWTGTVGRTWAEEWRRTDRSFAAFTPHFDAAILAAAPPDRFRAADIGCGAGSTSLALAAARPDAEVLGIDLSAELVAVATARAQDRANLAFVAGDALDVTERHASFDLIVSRHGVMFFADPVAAFARLHAAAAPDARLIFSCFRDRSLNPWAEEIPAAVLGHAPPPTEAGPGPFAFTDADRVETILREAGWRDPIATPVDYAYLAGEGEDPVTDAVAFFRRIGPAARLIRDAPPEVQPALLDRLAAAVSRYRHGNVVDFPAAAWIWSAAH